MPHLAFARRCSAPRAPPWRMGQTQQKGPAPRAAARACSVLPGRTSAAPPPERLEFESPARHCGKPGTLAQAWRAQAWRAQAPTRTARCDSSVLVGNGNVSAPLGSCWRPSDATKNNWALWPRWGSAGVWEGLRPCFGLTSAVSGCTLTLTFSCDRLEKTVFVPFTVLPGDPESQGDTTTTRAPGPVWELGANLCCQPVSGSGAA